MSVRYTESGRDGEGRVVVGISASRPDRALIVDFSILCRLFQQECRKLECGAANMTAEIERGTLRRTQFFVDY
jgi:hypothetical protein